LRYECQVCNNLSRLLYRYPPRWLFWVFSWLERHYLRNRISGICKLTIFMHRLAVNITHLKYKHIFLNILFNSTYYYIRTAFDSQSKIVVVSLKTTTRMRSFKSNFFCVVHDEHNTNNVCDNNYKIINASFFYRILVNGGIYFRYSSVWQDR